jgi:hypothetical protein
MSFNKYAWMEMDNIDILCIEDYLYPGKIFNKDMWYKVCICEREEKRYDGQLVFFDVAIFDKHFITKAEFREGRLNKILE